MRRIFVYIVFLLIGSGLVMAEDGNSPGKKTAEQADGYRLVWEDDFNGNSLNEKNNWTVILNGKGGGNKELQYYKRENIRVGTEPVSGENCLIITAKEEKYKFRKFTSGRLTTKDKMSFRYGKVEARIKFPDTANGLWPAFWMLGSDHPETRWPKCGEIDIVEMGNGAGIKNGIQNRYFNGACHWGEAFNRGKYPNYSKALSNPYSLQEDFHLFTMIWDKNAIKMYLDLDKYPDNGPYFEMMIDGQDEAGNPARYFHKPYVLIFNLAVGGNFTEIHSGKEITALSNGAAKMYVDYVRVYQKGAPEENLTMNLTHQ